MAYYTAGIIGPYIRNDPSGSLFDISGGNITITGTLTQGGGGAGTSNLVVPGYIRNDLSGSLLDISGGNIRNIGTTTTGTLSVQGGADTFMVAVGNGTKKIATSSNGSNWTGQTSPFGASNVQGVAWNGSYWVAASGAGIATSSNGSNWVMSDTTSSVMGAAWNGSLWVAVGDGTNKILTSTNGSNWTARTAPSGFASGSAVAWNGTYWVAVCVPELGFEGAAISRSSNGIDWNGYGDMIISYANGVAWGGGNWVVVGGNSGSGGSGALVTSSNTEVWNIRYPPEDFRLGYGVAWNGTYWVAVGVGEGAGKIITSSNATDWIAQTVPAGFTGGYGVTWNGKFWVVVGSGTSGNVVLTSPDGSNWTAQPDTNLANLLGVASRSSFPSAINIVDVSGGITYTGSLVGTTSTTSNSIGGVTLSNTRILTGAGTVAAPAYSFGGDTAMGLYDPATNVLGVVTSGTERMRVASNGNVGIGQTNPGYRLDVTASAASAASINMTTWPRFSISNVGFTRGVTAIRGTPGGVVQWRTFSNSLNANLLSITHSDTSGTFFQILKPGIWSIDWQLANSAIGFIETYLDVSTSLASTTYAAIPTMGSIVKYMRSESFVLGASYVGYLQSNASTYYRIWTSAGGISNNNYSQLRISYLGETDSNAIFPP